MAKAFNLGEELRKAGGASTVDTREQIEYIPLEHIDPDPENFYSIDGLNELAGNIELVGLQQPLRVRDGEKGHVTVVSGHRRRAAIMLIQDGGNDMFKGGVPCIREKPEALPEMQELKLIFANSQTRVMSAPELSRQAVKTRDLLARLRDRGYDFQGRTRELVASVLQTSDSRVGRLTAIRSRLVPSLLTVFDRGQLGESVAYRLCLEDSDVQRELSAKLGPAVQELTKDTVEKVIDQAKRDRAQPKAEAVGRVFRPQSDPDADGGPPRPSAPAEKTVNEHSAIDGLKKYLDERADEDHRFWMCMQEAADSLFEHSFAAGALPIRKDNIDMLRLDCRNAGVAGFAADWQGSNKGITLMHLSRNGGISRTWTEAYDALAAIAITRWRAVLTMERRKPKKATPSVDALPEWQTGTPPRDGRYFARIDMQDGRIHETAAEYRSANWFVFNSPLHLSFKVLGWWPLPDRG